MLRTLRPSPLGDSHMSVDIKCLSIDSPFTPILHPMTPPFPQSTPNDLLFPLLYQNFHKNDANFRALGFWEIYQFWDNFNIKFANFGLKLNFCTLNDPHFWESTSKKIPLFGAHTIDPLFSTKSYTECPYFRSPVGTFISECLPGTTT